MVKKKKASGTKYYPQKGTSNTKKDSARRAKKPGYRLSKTGNVYFENRKNRSDSKSEERAYKRQKTRSRKKSTSRRKKKR